MHMAPEEYSLFVAHLSNASEVQEILQWMKKVEGVREVRLTLEVEHIHVQDWLEGEIEKRLSTRATKPTGLLGLSQGRDSRSPASTTP